MFMRVLRAQLGGGVFFSQQPFGDVSVTKVVAKQDLAQTIQFSMFAHQTSTIMEVQYTRRKH